MLKPTKHFSPFPLFLVGFLVLAGFLGSYLTNANKPGVSAQVLEGVTDLSGLYKPEAVALFEGQEIPVPKEDTGALAQVLGSQTGERWIEVDLSDQKLIARDGDMVFLETKIASGLPWTPTPTGEFRVWGKFRYTKMEGGSGKYYYYLPNVPYVMFFENSEVAPFKGYGLHGTYWHNSFGTPRSHGCVNLPTPIAKELFYWTSPVLAEGKGTARASTENPGTRIVIHE